MTVRKLREMLMHFPDEALVFENSHDELIELHEKEVRCYPTGIGHPFADRDNEDEVPGPIVVFETWS